MVPKDERSVIKEHEEKEYYDVIKKLAMEAGFSELNPDDLHNLMISYLK